ncbi:MULTISPECIES: DNA replication initiation control protein YabA [Apilactobacillus]|uniref:Replication initiation control protein YabA n=2 Tax=Apilactobacillus TaxID=2767877 RepID=A0A2S2JL18_9LACO|nr:MULTISPECIES: DNA replication initiation control protein YabA [Apilactobacillus]TPR12546.1 DNA replication initiation control protein YabA [Apilactobacillus timberlakei]TPR13377.1 DNA replication initiation control protein YabA [Apilactobacillus timberlakei]TPR15450.1 DNA replication initiation control protein YabA [Apilactobacillus timberlakei]TPR17709.1 DNA replication initiation control protein YabA [Apilactobacillus timberlakei]TPR17926.1 DNA replication initiation control protein YabA 
MDKRELYDGFKNMEAQTQLMLTKFSELREGLAEVLEENAELKIENQHLHEFIEEQKIDDKNVESIKEPRLSKSRKNLEKLYNEGFHVCNQFYGTHREDNESCIFCNEILNR